MVSRFQNHRHREKILSQRHHETSFEESLDDSLNCWGEEDESRMGYPYNPGHRKTKFTDHQKFYLQSFFSEKEYADDEDINDLTAELQLTPKVVLTAALSVALFLVIFGKRKSILEI